MRNPNPLNNTCLFRAGLLAVALMLAQWGMTGHQLDVADHAADVSCQFCLSHTNLGGALPATPIAAPVVTAAAYRPPFAPLVSAQHHHEPYTARAPPTLSL